jgi:hypothetical protein
MEPSPRQQQTFSLGIEKGLAAEAALAFPAELLRLEVLILDQFALMVDQQQRRPDQDARPTEAKHRHDGLRLAVGPQDDEKHSQQDLENQPC